MAVRTMRGAGLVLAAILALAAGRDAAAGVTLDAVKKRGYIQCGVSQGAAGFSLADAAGVFRGLDVDMCRAVAAALFGDADKVKFTPLSAQQRFTALQSGEIDMLARTSTWTLQRAAALGLHFTVVNFYDGQGFLVPKKLGVKSAKELKDATVCVQPGSLSELNLADFFRRNNLAFKPLVIEALPEMKAAFFAGRCDAISNDSGQLASYRAADAANPDDYLLLPEIISKEPNAPVVRKGDEQWYDIVYWSIQAMIDAEERGITATTVDEALKSTDPVVQRLLGVTAGNGQALGVDEKWAYNIVKLVGNYGESFERNIGMGSPLKMQRGLNDLWTRGGLMYAPPLR